MAYSETIDHVTLSHLVTAGALHSVNVIGQHDSWSLIVGYGNKEAALAARQSKKIRQFKQFDTLTNYLKSIGIVSFHVDAANYDPAIKTRTNSAQAKLMKEKHQAAAHNQWFKAEVEKGLKQLQDQPTNLLDHEEVFTNIEQRYAD